ncbi:MAG: C1 family peptidase [Mucilaginibacter sp.]|nr:C1 family peptidase [Mucilaginibacter sp.]
MYRLSSRYGWRPDLPDHRDLAYAAPAAVLGSLPPKVDLTSQCPPVYDQGQLGSCTANSIGAAFEFELLKQKLPDFMPSRLFIYYNERAIENTINSDSGAQIRDGIKSIAKQGVCSETSWPYVISEFAIKPYQACYTEASHNTAISYHRVSRDINQMRGCLANGYPFVIGFTVYSSFESPQVAQTGVLNLPAPDENAIGGHAVLVVGYDDSSSRFTVRNSWGETWGQKGYFTMPYQYLLDANLSDDFWTIRVVS